MIIATEEMQFVKWFFLLLETFMKNIVSSVILTINTFCLLSNVEIYILKSIKQYTTNYVYAFKKFNEFEYIIFYLHLGGPFA